MPMINYVFYFFAALLIISASYAVTTKNIIRAVFALFFSFFCVSGIFVFAHADFLAITQIVVYVGGVLVIILFGIMLSNKNALDLLKRDSTNNVSFKLNKIIPGAIALCMLFVLIILIRSNTFSFLDWMQADRLVQSSVRQTGINLMTSYLLPFEIISLILLMVLIAATFVARKEPKN